MNEEFNSSLIIYQMASYSISATFRVLCNWINLQLFFPPCAASATCEEGKWLVNGNAAFGKVSVVSQTWVLFCLLAKSSMEIFFFPVLSSWIKFEKDQTQDQHRSAGVIMAVTRRINSDGCFFSLLCISGVCLLLIKTHRLGSSWWHYKWEDGSCSTVAKVMSVWIWKCSTYFRYQIKYFIAYDHWEHLKVTFHMSEQSFSALKETLKWTGKPWAPLLTCLRATHRMAAEANRYQSPGFCQTRRHAPRPWVLLVDTGDESLAVSLSPSAAGRQGGCFSSGQGWGDPFSAPSVWGDRQVGEVWDRSPPT